MPSYNIYQLSDKIFINDIYNENFNNPLKEDEDISYCFISSGSSKDPTWEQRIKGKSTIEIIIGSNMNLFKKW